MTKKTLLLGVFLLASVFACFVKAQNVIPYLPQKADFGGASVALGTFAPSGGDYTLEVNGTAGTEISVAGGVYTYTPETTGKIRFAQKKNVVYVYEGNVFKTTLTPVSKATFPDIFGGTDDAGAKTGIYDPANLLSNPGFESITGPNLNTDADKRYATEDWTPTTGYSSADVRVNVDNPTYAPGREGLATFMWRNDNDSKNNTTTYFYQLLGSELKANTPYKIKFQILTHNQNRSCNWRVGVGSTPGGYEYSLNVFSTANTNFTLQYFEFTFTTPSTVAGDAYFTVGNNGDANNNTWTIIHLDRMTLVEGDSPAGIEGATAATYLEGAAYAPEFKLSGGDCFDMTSFIVNADVTGGTGWSDPTTNSGEQFTGSPDAFYLDKWNANAYIYDSNQQIAGLPNGIYKLVAAVRSSVETFKLYAVGYEEYSSPIPATGNIGNTLGNGWQYLDVNNIIVDAHTLKIGIGGNGAAGAWVGGDVFRLYYYGEIPTDNPASTPETTLVPGKSYYLYNAGADKFLAFGGDWATEGVVSQRGAPVTFTEVSEGSGTYYLQFTNVSNDWDMGTKSYLRTSDLYTDQKDMNEEVGIFNITQAEGDSYFTLLSTDVNANGKYLAANADSHINDNNDPSGKWGVAKGIPAYGLNMAAAESDYTQWYFYDVDLFNARYNLSKLLKIAGDLGVSVYDYIEAYNAATTVDAVNAVIDAVRADIAGAVSAPVDFTSYVDDAGINDGVTPISIAKWVSINPANENRRNVPGQFEIVSNGVVTAGSFEYYNTSFNFNQALYGLPKGKYTLKAQAFERASGNDKGVAYQDGTEVIQTKIYAASSSLEFTQPVKSLYEHPYESFMGGTALNGYIDAMSQAQNAFLNGYYEVELNDIVVGEDGLLTIGIKKDVNVDQSWTLFDNFRLIYEGDAIGALNDLLAKKIAAAEDCLANADMGWFNKTELDDAIAAGNAVEQTYEAITDAINGLDAAINNFNDIVARYQPLKDKIAEATANLDTDPCADLLQAAIDAAQAVYDNPVEQTATDIKAAVAALGVVPVNCYLAGLATPPSVADPADLTSFLANPDFEALQADRQQTIPGWTKTGADNSEFCTRNNVDATVTPIQSGNVYFQYWSNASPRPDYSLSQEVYLPNGFYKLTAGAGTGGTGFSVFANAVEAVVSSTKEYSLQVEVTNNVLTIGIKSVNRSFDWSFADNFRLYYYGTEAPASPALEVDKATLNFFPFSKEQSFTVTGKNLTGPVTLTAPTGITLSKTSISVDEAQAEGGAAVTATFTGTSAITGGSIAIASEGAVSQSTAVNSFPLTGDNLVQYWSGLGAEAAGTKPNDVGWSNTTGSAIPWAVANDPNGGCRFRDDVSGITYESDGTPLAGRYLMLRWDGNSYNTSVYAYPVVLDAETAYKFNFDVFFGNNGDTNGDLIIGISATPDGTGCLSAENAGYTTANSVNVAPTYTFTSEAAGLYYMTFKGDNYSNSNQPWIGVANLMLVKNDNDAIETPSLASKLFVYPTVTSGVLNVNKPEGTKVSVFDMAGNKVMETILSNPLNVGSLKAGVYIIGTANGERAKFIKK